jgi:hypothetical protein
MTEQRANHAVMQHAVVDKLQGTKITNIMFFPIKHKAILR